jgi:cyclopropane fatty-acyl-phospholipid synthase-like methyltransferase
MYRLYETELKYPFASNYTNYYEIYAESGGPGGLEFTEFIAEKLNISPGMRLLDINTYRGYKSCFLAREFDVLVVGIEPMNSISYNQPSIEHLENNAEKWGVKNKVIGIKTGILDSRFANNTFDAVYSTTSLKMATQSFSNKEKSLDCFNEIYRILRPNGLIGIGEP